VVHIYLRQRCSDSSVNRTILKSWLAVAARQDFPNVKFRIAAHIRYRRKQSGSGIRTMMRIRLKKLISSSMSWHLSTRNILSKYMHVFLSNLANKQTDKHGQKHVPPALSDVTIANLVATEYQFWIFGHITVVSCIHQLCACGMQILCMMYWYVN